MVNKYYSNGSISNPGRAFSSNAPTFGCILLFGPPGCGKTHFLRSTANEFGLRMEFVRCKSLREDLVEGIKTQIFFKKLFSRARERAPSMIILDKIDEITSENSLADIKIRKAVYQLLRELERIKAGDRLLVTATTNKPHKIEPLLFKAKRFDKLLYVPMPDLESRQELFKLFLQKYNLADDINFKILGRISKGFNGADIKRVVQSVGAEARNLKSSITMKYLERAVNNIGPSITPSILEPIKHFFIRNKKGILGDQSLAEEISRDTDEETDSDFEFSIDEEDSEIEPKEELEHEEQVIEWEENENEIETEKDEIEDEEVEDWDNVEKNNYKRKRVDEEKNIDEDAEEEEEEDEDEDEEDDEGINYRKKWVKDDYRP